MKKILFLLTILVSVPAFSQSADERIGAFLNQADWFGLEKNYPILKDSMQADFLKLMSEALIGYYFNRPDEALQSIHKLLVNHQAEIGGQNALNMAILACQIDGLKGNYATAAQNSRSIMEQLKQQNAEQGMYKSLEGICYFYDQLKNIPAPGITCPQEDIIIPVDIEKVKLPTSIEPKGWRGTTILIPVTINGKTYQFIFDTGAGTSYMSQRMAKETGVRILSDSLIINSNLPGAMTGNFGTLENMQIGSITFHNSLITIAPPNEFDSIMIVDAVLGMDFIGLFDEVRIYPKDKKIVFPKSSTPLPSYGRNLMKVDRALKLKAQANGETLMLHFDTGNSTAGLFYQYYEKHKAEFESIGKKEKITGGGFNHVVTKDILRLPSFDMEIGDATAHLKNLAVDITPNGIPAEDDGNIGMDMINQFDCVTINLKDMFLKLE